MNADAMAKVIKSIILFAGLAGYQIDPDQIQTIVEGCAAAYAIIAGFEGWLKTKRGGA